MFMVKKQIDAVAHVELPSCSGLPPWLSLTFPYPQVSLSLPPNRFVFFHTQGCLVWFL